LVCKTTNIYCGWTVHVRLIFHSFLPSRPSPNAKFPQVALVSSFHYWLANHVFKNSSDILQCKCFQKLVIPYTFPMTHSLSAKTQSLKW
jgi:hypothetical protein